MRNRTEVIFDFRRIWLVGVLYFSHFIFLDVSFAREVVGVAKDIKSKDILYTETHKIEVDPAGLNRKIRTEYQDVKGKLFATMNSDFNQSQTVPEITFEDNRRKIKEESFFSEDKKKIIFRLTGSDGGVKEESFEYKDNVRKRASPKGHIHKWTSG